MARRLRSRAKGPDVIDGFAPPSKPRPKKKAYTPMPKARRRAFIDEVQERMRTQEWDGMTTGRLVALYWLCHERVYGVVPSELDNAAVWSRAMLHAGKMVASEFDDDVGRAVVFMRWVWTRERDIEEWRRRNQRNGRRISWLDQFCYGRLVSDWRIAAARQTGG